MKVDKIVCAGKNYLEHALELGDDVPEKPVIFLKPASILKAASNWGDTVIARLPNDDDEVHYECEIVLQIKNGGYKLTQEEAAKSIGAVTLGLDMTLRERQTLLKKQGHPWTTAKVFIDSAIIGPWIDFKEFENFQEEEFSFTLDKEVRQHGFGRNMTTKPVELISYISNFFPLCDNDIIFTGTPAGVGRVNSASKATLKWGEKHYNVDWIAEL